MVPSLVRFGTYFRSYPQKTSSANHFETDFRYYTNNERALCPPTSVTGLIFFGPLCTQNGTKFSANLAMKRRDQTGGLIEL